MKPRDHQNKSFNKFDMNMLSIRNDENVLGYQNVLKK